MLAASDLFSGAPQGINYLSSLARDKERSLETNSAQFLNNFHTLHPWSNFKPQVTMWINSNDQGYFWKAINISLLKKWGENTFTKWSFQWLGAGLGTVKSSLTRLCFPPNESLRYRANASDSGNTPYGVSLPSFPSCRDFP